MTDAAPDPEDDPLIAIAQAPRFGDGLSMRRIGALAPQIAPQPAPSVKIAGSNGKGSTAILTDFMLSRFGLLTGRFLSPHVLRPNERVAIGGMEIEDEPLRAALGYALDLRTDYEQANSHDRLSAFEIWFLAALILFEQAQVDVMILEAGLGGRYDPTRWPRSRLGALTALDAEHADVLGPTLEHIACEKADIVCEGGRLVVGPLPEDVRTRLDAYLALRDVTPIHLTDHAAVSPRSVAFAGAPALACAFDSPHPRFAENAGVARLLAADALEGFGRAVDARAFNLAFTDACAAFRPPGRLRRIGGAPECWVDMGHTPLALTSAVSGVAARASTRRMVAVLSWSASKPTDALIASLLQSAPDIRMIFTRAETESADPSAALARADAAGAVDAQAIADPKAAIAAARRSAGADGVVLILGGAALAKISSP